MPRHNPITDLSYYQDLRARYGDRIQTRIADSIARAHGTSLASLEEGGLQTRTGLVDVLASAKPLPYVDTLAFVSALGYGE